MNVFLSLFRGSVGSPKDGINLEVLNESQQEDESERADAGDERPKTVYVLVWNYRLDYRVGIAMHK